MSFFKKLFPKRPPPTIPIENIDQELDFVKNILSQSFSKTYLLQRLEPQEFDIKEEADEEMVFQGRFGFFLLKLNEDAEIYDFIYTDTSGISHHLVKGDHNNYGHITFDVDK